MAKRSILFICLGNICRSPLAEGVVRAVLEERGMSADFHLDSAGLGDWHSGNQPDRRSIAVAKANGLDISGQCARRICAADFQRFDLLLAMDRANIAALGKIAPPEARDRIHLFLDFAEASGAEVPDPYYGAESDFEHVYRLIRKASEALAVKLLELPLK